MHMLAISRLWLSIALLTLVWPSKSWAEITIPEDSTSAVVLAYHRIGEDAYPDTNLRIEQFLSHIGELSEKDYTILPLPDIISALKNGEKLPPKTIALTFEGAYKSALKNAAPLLLEKNMPFTVFFSSDHADSDSEQHLNWEDLRSLSRHEYVSLGLLPASYTRLSEKPHEEILTQINKARMRYREHFNQEAKLFSYPFGEYTPAFKDIIKEQGFESGFGLHSGAVSSASDFMALPRFTMTEIYGDLERFKLVTGALPLPVSDTEPQDPHLKTASPVIGFSVTQDLRPHLKTLSCFVSGQPQPTIETPGENRAELRLAEPITEERTRVNCTMPGPEGNNETPRWRWFGMLLVGKKESETEITPLQDGLP